MSFPRRRDSLPATTPCPVAAERAVEVDEGGAPVVSFRHPAHSHPQLPLLPDMSARRGSVDDARPLLIRSPDSPYVRLMGPHLLVEARYWKVLLEKVAQDLERTAGREA